MKVDIKMNIKRNSERTQQRTKFGYKCVTKLSHKKEPDKKY